MSPLVVVRMVTPLAVALVVAPLLLVLRSWPLWLLAVLLGPVLYLVAGPRLFGPFLHYFTWDVPRQWGTDLRMPSLVRYVGFIGLFYPVLAASSVVSLMRQWREPDAWRVQLVFAMLTGLVGALDRGSAENVFIPMGTFFVLVGTIGLAEWSARTAHGLRSSSPTNRSTRSRCSPSCRTITCSPAISAIASSHCACC